MASARRIVLTAVKQRRGIPQWSRTEIASPRTRSIDLSKCSPSINSNKNRHLSTNRHDYEYFREIGFPDLLSTPERDFLVRNNGQKVPVSSLKGKLVGMFLCAGEPFLPLMEPINEVYEEAKSRGYDFEIVLIMDRAERQFRNHDISWLTLPSMDSSFTKIQRIFQCLVDREDGNWIRDSLVLIYPCHQDSSGFLFEFAGTKILQRWGIEGYPFTRPSLYKAEYELQKRGLTLQWLFPLGKLPLLRPRPGGEGFDVVDVLPQLSGKRVLVLFAKNSFARQGAKFLSMLKSEYEAQVEDNVAGGSKFEVVYISTEPSRVSFCDVSTKDMPWLVQPFPSDLHGFRLRRVFKPCPEGSVAVAFNEQGELIGKEDFLDEKVECENLGFPFIDPDLEKCIRLEVETILCDSADPCMYLW